MLKEKEKILLNHLREDSRRSLTKISKDTGIPVSTLFELIKKLEGNVIIKHTSILDFARIGYNFKVSFAIASKNKYGLKEFLINHDNVNTLSRSINGYDFYVECLFKDLKEMEDFKEQINKFNLAALEQNFVVEELKKEGFSL